MAAAAAFGACGLFQDTQLEVLAGECFCREGPIWSSTPLISTA